MTERSPTLTTFWENPLSSNRPGRYYVTGKRRTTTMMAITTCSLRIQVPLDN